MLATHITKLARSIILCYLAALLLANHSYASPRVLVSIKPIHSLVSHITHGISQAELLLNKQQSPHHFQLRPSQKRMLNQADVFFYSSDNIESFIDKLKNSSNKAKFIELASQANINALQNRSFHSHSNDHHEQNIDGHIWLSIDNAKIISHFISNTLSELDPVNSSRYKMNLQSLLNRLEELKNNNLRLLSLVSDKPFLIYHDAYQYFEQENQLTNAHFITTTPEHSPGIKRIKELKQLIDKEQIQCIFYEPPNIPPFIETLVEDKAVTLAAIDPTGSQLKAGKQHYFDLMQQTADAIFNCLRQE